MNSVILYLQEIKKVLYEINTTLKWVGKLMKKNSMILLYIVNVMKVLINYRILVNNFKM